jgi:hypothetical protein
VITVLVKESGMAAPKLPKKFIDTSLEPFRVCRLDQALSMIVNLGRPLFVVLVEVTDVDMPRCD